MRMIVATFATEMDSDRFVDSLHADSEIERRAIATGILAAYGAPHHGHRLVAVWVRRELEPVIRARAEAWGGQLHDVSGSVVEPRWVQEFIAARGRVGGGGMDQSPEA
jgi:hypothetical protein